MDIQTVAGLIQSHRQGRTLTGPLTAGRALTLEEAYAVQVEVARQREVSQDPVVGYKLGLISRAKQQQMKVNEPVIGHVHRSMLINPGEPIVRERLIQPRVEPELAVVFGRPVSPGARRSDCLAAVSHVLLAIDVLDSIYAGYQFTAADVVADNASGGAVVLGGRPLEPDVLWQREGFLRLALDGGEWVAGEVAALGDPIRLIEWAVERTWQLGRGIRAGDMVLLGAPCAATALGEAKMLVAEGPRGTTLVAAVR